MNGISAELEFSHRVVNMSMSYGSWIVCTTNQCHVYVITQQNWTSPFVFDVKDSVMMIVQGHKFFALIDASLNFNIYAYDGKLVSSPKS